MSSASRPPAMDFSLPATGNTTVSLSALRGNPFVLYFYPKDNTPGCTTETAAFRDHHDAFIAAGCAVFGVSRDSLKSHENFKTKLGLPFELLSDSDESACLAYDVIKMKNMYGKQVRGIVRSTFVIDAHGRIAREWRGVKVPAHVEEVLEFVRTL
ncbi:MAG: peroxiredoxin [Rhodocyclales bacterium]|nr:peroxiredoxin [Rhodocyclales bacterium]